MTQDEFDMIASMHRTRAAYQRVRENIESDKAQTYGVTITAEDLMLIGSGIIDFVDAEIRGINAKVEEL